MNSASGQTALVRSRPSDDGQLVHPAAPATGPAVDAASALHHRIAARAFELFSDRCRNGRCGDEVSDWLAAEQEVRASAALESRQGQPLELQVKSRGLREKAAVPGL